MFKYLFLAAAMMVLVVACNKKDAPAESAPTEQYAPADVSAPEAVEHDHATEEATEEAPAQE